MTVTYSLQVARARLSGFPKLLLRWKGSIYKLLYREMLIFCGLYYFLLVLYRLLLNETQRRVFEKLAIYCEAFTDLIPLSFVLGFYVTIVVSRWWHQYLAIPWPDKTCMLISAYVNGNDERGRMIRRTLARYINLMSALTFQAISTAVKKRFPTIDHIVEAGLMTEEEHDAYNEIPIIHGKWWVPAQWFTSLVVRARKEGRIKDDVPLKQLLDELHVFRGNCGLLFSFDWISIPLVYTQVVTLAIYTYFIATVMGRQYLDPKKGYPGHDIDLYIPVFTLLQFFFYMGWLKVAEQLINPFGEDDDDFELNWCLDRNLQLSFSVVDEMHQKHPRLIRDVYWDESEPQLPYTKSSFNHRSQPHLGSAVNLNINPSESEFITMETIKEEDKEVFSYNSPSRSPSYDFQDSIHFANTVASPSRRTSIGSIENDSSWSKLIRNLDFPRMFNMIVGSNRDLSQSSYYASSKENSSNLLNTPFFSKPSNSRKECSPCLEQCSDNLIEDKFKPDESTVPFLSHLHTDSGCMEENEKVTAVENHSFPEKSSDHCIIKIPDLSVVEEESPSIVRVVSPIGNPHSDLVIKVDESAFPPLDQETSLYHNASILQESLIASSDGSQSTTSSYCELLEQEN